MEIQPTLMEMSSVLALEHLRNLTEKREQWLLQNPSAKIVFSAEHKVQIVDAAGTVIAESSGESHEDALGAALFEAFRSPFAGPR